MSELEKMQRYIDRTKPGIKNPIQYTMNVAETLELLNMAQKESDSIHHERGRNP